jgi:hypothetical protein
MKMEAISGSRVAPATRLDAPEAAPLTRWQRLARRLERAAEWLATYPPYAFDTCDFYTEPDLLRERRRRFRGPQRGPLQ